MLKQNKFLLMGTDNEGFRHRYSFRKNESFKKSFLSFMESLNFDAKEFRFTFIKEDEDGEQIELKISEFEDCIRHYKNKMYDVDVFYGNKKIIILVRTRKREPMVKYLEKEGKWIKPIVAKKVKENNKNKEELLIKIRK